MADAKSLKKLVASAVKAMRANQHAEALSISQEVLVFEPDHAGANAVAFTAHFTAGNFEQARLIGEQAAVLNPSSEYILNNQACLQLEAKQPAAASRLLKSLIQQHGEKPQWLYNLGLAERMAGDLENSIPVFQSTLALQPNHDKAAYQLADVYHALGKIELATQQLNYLRLLRPAIAATHSQYLHQAAVSGMVTATDLDLEFRLWGARFIPKDKIYPMARPENVEKLRLGFNLGVIPESWWSDMIVPVLNGLCKNDKVFVYWHDQENTPRHLNSDIQVLQSASMSDAKFARAVRKDEIDILIDVCGMRMGCRQRALGLQLAGIQLGWLAHEGYYSSDLITPIEARLGEQRFCFANPENNAADTSQDAEKTLFGINASAGLTETVVHTWATILLQLEGWVLHLDAQHPGVQKELQQRFSKHNLNAPRITFNSRLKPASGCVVLENPVNNDVLKAYTALRHGAAVVALKGDLFPAQQTSALLAQIGKADWIAEDRADYQAKALELVKDVNFAGLPQTYFDQARLQDVDRFVKHFRKVITD